MERTEKLFLIHNGYCWEAGKIKLLTVQLILKKAFWSQYLVQQRLSCRRKNDECDHAFICLCVMEESCSIDHQYINCISINSWKKPYNRFIYMFAVYTSSEMWYCCFAVFFYSAEFKLQKEPGRRKVLSQS